MIYILILTYVAYGDTAATMASIEFNTLESCQAAAKEWKRQYDKNHTNTGIVFCAEKGKANK